MTSDALVTAMPYLVDISGLKFKRDERVILDGVDIKIQRGKITAIMGPSGTGKTTLLRLIGRELQAEAGTILVNGQNVMALSNDALYRLRKSMGMMFQSGALFTDLTVYENVAFPLRQHTQLSESMIRHVILMKLEAVGLRGASDLMPNELSAGMARRVALARAIVLDPMMVMYDEPFTGQDPITVGVVMKLIRFLNDSLGITGVLVSHDVKEVLAIADYLYVISEGKVVAHGSPDVLKESPSAWVQQFLQGKPDGPAAFHYSKDDYVEDLLSSNG